ncbi:hypothetical protein ZEAMMB73_Zm00001d029646 [Zea mays]|uniref:Uridine nucleosidase 2 n=1 Tax=Zea mays TaxID=4577 RepID=A0A1D6PP58_MAIZE|nr:hypothetical protein ZEAMMB73_Zm00001d048701 [Zea mays]ONL99172.1 hypothetical protein ZEAMMB73_Zm00001d029646 [Zea mays]
MVVEAAVAAVLVEEMWWRQLDSIVSAVSFGLMSMFLAIAILEHFLRPLAHTLEHAPPRGIRHRLLLFLSRGGERSAAPSLDLEAATKLQAHAPLEMGPMRTRIRNWTMGPTGWPRGAAMPFHGVPHQLSEVHKKRTLYHPELPSASRDEATGNSPFTVFIYFCSPDVRPKHTTRKILHILSFPLNLIRQAAQNIANIPVVTLNQVNMSTDRTEPLFDGADDTMAIFLALRSPKLEVLGLTTTFGNVHTALATRNALHLLEAVGRTDIPMAEGSHPTIKKATKLRIASFVHGSDGLRIASFVHGSDGHCGSSKHHYKARVKVLPGSHIWVEDKDLSWVDGEVFRIDGQNAHVRTTKGKAVCVALLLKSVTNPF